MKVTFSYFDDFIRKMRSFRPDIEFASEQEAEKFAFSFLKELFKFSISYDED